MDKKNPLSIIIPTFNEADYLGYLLFSLSRQTHKDFEVIISDGASEDETLKIAQTFQNLLPVLKIISSDKRSPAHQRNQGVKIARHERLLFLDADVILPLDFLEKASAEIEEKNLDFANPLVFPVSKKVIDYYLHVLTNVGLDFIQDVSPVGLGCALFSTKSWHQKLEGFDERLKKIREDFNYVSRARKLGARFDFLRECAIYVSVRRLESEGRIRFLKNLMVGDILVFLFGEYKAQDLIGKSFGNFGRLKKTLEREKEKSFLLKPLTKDQFKRFLKKLEVLVKNLV